MSDPINPDHYKRGGLETIEIMKKKLTPEEFRGKCKGDQYKYLDRRGYKVEKDVDEETWLRNCIQECDKQNWYCDAEKQSYQERLNQILEQKARRHGSPVIDEDWIEDSLHDED